jgi:tellurite resistance protein TehA-like permease
MPAASTTPASFGQRLLAQAAANTFTSVMGTAGLGLLWRTAGQVLNLPAAPGEWMLTFSAVIFVLLLGAHLLRVLRLRTQWRNEFQDKCTA